MAKNWYTLQVYAGYEKKVLGEIKRLLENNELDSSVVSDVKVLTEETVENKKGKKVVKTSILVAGYMFLEMGLPQFGWKDTCNKIRHVHGVNGFVGTKPSERPRAIPVEEAKALLMRAGELKGEKAPRVKFDIKVGEKVKITEGPFANFEGSVEQVDPEKNKLNVNVQIFGRATPLELDVGQVEKI